MPSDEASKLKRDLDAEKIDIDRSRAETERARLAVEQQRLKVEEYRIQLEHHRAQLAARELDKPLVEGVMRFANLVVRSLLILNGGAALALLSFSTNNARADLSVLVFWFGLGAWLSVATAGASYIAQVFIVESKSEKIRFWLGEGVRLAAIACGIGALATFGWGMLQVSQKLAPTKAAMLVDILV